MEKISSDALNQFEEADRHAELKDKISEIIVAIEQKKFGEFEQFKQANAEMLSKLIASLPKSESTLEILNEIKIENRQQFEKLSAILMKPKNYLIRINRDDFGLMESFSFTEQ